MSRQQTLLDQFELDFADYLGEGANARVYRAWDRIGMEDVAIKILNDSGTPPRFKREIGVGEIFHGKQPDPST